MLCYFVNSINNFENYKPSHLNRPGCTLESTCPHHARPVQAWYQKVFLQISNMRFALSLRGSPLFNFNSFTFRWYWYDWWIDLHWFFLAEIPTQANDYLDLVEVQAIVLVSEKKLCLLSQQSLTENLGVTHDQWHFWMGWIWVEYG